MKINNSKTGSFKIKLLLFICLFFIVGCGVQENFRYLSKGEDAEFPWGHVAAGLDGMDKVGFFKVTRGSPYVLWCHFTFDKREHMEGTVLLSNVKIINARTNKLLVERDNLMENSITQSYNAVWVETERNPSKRYQKELIPNMHQAGFTVFDALRFKDQEVGI